MLLSRETDTELEKLFEIFHKNTAEGVVIGQLIERHLDVVKNKKNVTFFLITTPTYYSK